MNDDDKNSTWPAAGGSYERQADGSLLLTDRTSTDPAEVRAIRQNAAEVRAKLTTKVEAKTENKVDNAKIETKENK